MLRTIADVLKFADPQLICTGVQQNQYKKNFIETIHK